VVALTCPFAEWGIAGAARAGESVSGDLPVVRSSVSGLLVACVDGVGHGQEAALVAMSAGQVLEAGVGLPIPHLLDRCHRTLRGTRGASLLAAWFDPRAGSLTWAGVGEIFGVAVRGNARARPAREILLPHPGLAGHRMPAGIASRLSIDPGDTLVLATDGVRDAFLEERWPDEEPSRLAERILARHHRPDDDALVVAVRFRSGAP